MKEQIRALRIVVATAFRADPARAVAVFVLTAMNSALGALGAYWLKLLADGAFRHSLRLVTIAAAGMAASGLLNGLMAWYGFSLRTVLMEKTSVLIDARLIQITAGVPGIEHHERPDYQNELALLRIEREQLSYTVSALVGGLAILVQMVTSAALLLSVSPILLLLPLFGIPSVWTGAVAVRMSQRALEETVERERMTTHLFKLATTASSGKELRIFGLGPELVSRHRRTWDEINKRRLSVNYRAAGITAAGWAIFGLGYVAAVVFVVVKALSGQAEPGTVLLVLTLAAQVNGLVDGAVTSTAVLLRSLKVAGRLVWLNDYAAEHRSLPRRERRVPPRISEGVSLENVTFQYPGTEWEVLEDVSIRIPAGSTVALVGENGAGKTTIVKLLGRFYSPSAGTIRLDDIDIASFDIEQWRAALSAGFQDFARFEFVAREVVGVGDLPRIEDEHAVDLALRRAGALDVVGSLPMGMNTQLGRSFEEGVDLSGGQWQKLALGRALMREPLILILDEPTAGLDAQTEHELFVKYVDASRRAREERGAITVLVSHRFSTVRMADLILVVEDGRISSSGSHDELMRAGGTYAELYELQASHYR